MVAIQTGVEGGWRVRGRGSPTPCVYLVTWHSSERRAGQGQGRGCQNMFFYDLEWIGEAWVSYNGWLCFATWLYCMSAFLKRDIYNCVQGIKQCSLPACCVKTESHIYIRKHMRQPLSIRRVKTWVWLGNVSDSFHGNWFCLHVQLKYQFTKWYSVVKKLDIYIFQNVINIWWIILAFHIIASRHMSSVIWQ